MVDGNLIPIALFVSIAYAIKAVVDARVRGKLIAAGSSEEIVRSLLLSEQVRRRHSSLHWGIVLVFMAAGFGLIEIFGWRDVTPGAIAVLLAATGAGELAFYLFARRLEPRSASAGERPK